MDPRRRKILAVGIVLIVAGAGIGAYFLLPRVPATCRSGQTSTICVDQAEIPDSLDPAVTFSTPGWAAVQQVYQGLVNYNGSSATQFAGVLAKNWTSGTDVYTGLEEVTFNLRTGVHFANGDPYNAYVQWYSFYRSLLLAQGPQFILEQNFYSTNFSASNPLTYYSNSAAINASNATLVNDLNTWSFSAPTPSELLNMEFPQQSFQVLNATAIELNLGYGYLGSNYTYLFATLSAPNSYAVDPIWIDQHGGVLNNTVNTFAATNTMGTGPYQLSGYNGLPGGGYTLTPDSNYWGRSAAANESWNTLIQPARLPVDVRFQGTLDSTITDLKNGVVQTASFAYLGPSTISQLQGISNLNVAPLPTVYGSTSGSWWIYLNQSVAPFNSLLVREAIAHAINYSQIIQNAFGGFAQQWVGPVPPAYPYYNPAGLAPYAYNLTQARAEIALSPCAHNACNGTPITYEYLTPGADWSDTANYLAADLAQIGLTITPKPISLTSLYAEQSLSGGNCTTATTANGGPFYMGQEFYTSDYISPDDWTQNDAISYGSANACMSGYDNSTVDNLTLAAAAESNPATLTADYTAITQAMYSNYTDIWLVVPTSFSVTATNFHGFVQNPMASAEPFALLFNTDTIS